MASVPEIASMAIEAMPPAVEPRANIDIGKLRCFAHQLGLRLQKSRTHPGRYVIRPANPRPLMELDLAQAGDMLESVMTSWLHDGGAK